jgi:hypothetical protein
MKTMADRAASWADHIMGWVDRATVVIVKSLYPILLGVALGYAWRMAQGG